MKINEIIRQLRLQNNMTQEQVASFLGVSAPAVNKWEKGVSYPDITLLPALARLLNTDLNTLLSFKSDLTAKEIALFLNRISAVMKQDGFEAGYILAMDQVKEYPSCDELILNVAMSLDGALGMYGTKENLDEYKKQIETLYQRAACSKDAAVKQQAQGMLIHKLMQNREYEKAEELLQAIPDKNSVDKQQIQVNLLLAQEKMTDAARLAEEKLLASTTEIHTTLMTLMEIAIREKRISDAEYIADVAKKFAQTLDLWEYTSYVGHFQLYSACKNRIKCMKVFIPMLKAAAKRWDLTKSPLYRHIKTKETDVEFGKTMQKTLIHSMMTDEEMEFLREDSQLQELKTDLHLDCNE